MKGPVSLKTVAAYLTSAILLIGGGGFVQVISTNQVSGTATMYRWEPASSVCFSDGNVSSGIKLGHKLERHQYRA